ncbi:MAG: hypothetical protein UY63_C0018G0016 [Parcubacteria group bacterium GW2011_GWA2_51_10]|nr:MAG: hypothetical protein UY63_C0018G0016 [Parcubacteria group bacterium GW2011_GWA2_51_10]
MEPRILHERIVPRALNFKSPEEELQYLRERVREKENELEIPKNRFESDRIAKREIAEYSKTPATEVLHEAVVMPEHETVRHALKLDPEAHDTQMDELLEIVSARGIRNALSVAERLKNPHIEDDLHRMLVRYIAEGLPEKGIPPPERVNRALHMVLFEIHPQAHGEKDKEQGQKLEQVLSSSEQLYAGLTSLISPHEGFSLEIAVPEGSEEAGLYLAVPRIKQTLAERLISSVFPNARISECRGDYNIFNYAGDSAGAVARLAEHPAFPLKTYEQFEHDPLNVLLAAFAKIAKHGEGAAIQFVVSTAGDRYNRHYKKMLRAVEKGKTIEKALRVPETVLGEVIHDIGKAAFMPKDYVEEKDKEFRRASDQVATEAIGRKLKSRVAPVVIRLAASAGDKKRARELLQNLMAPFNQFDDSKGNRLVFKEVSAWGIRDFLREFTFREFDSGEAIPLGLAEVATMFHFTAERVTTSRELKRSFAKQAPAPVEVGSDGIVLGINRYGAIETLVHFSPLDRLRHCYVIGQTGTGKTGLLKNMIIQDIKNGEGVAFIDPHGNDIEDVLAAIPPERAADVVYFDPAYTARPMGLNMLEYDRSKPEMKTFVGGSTFVEIPRVFADPAFRNLKLSRCNNPIIVQFWKKIAEAAQGDPSLENVAPYITSKFDVFLTNDIIRPIVSQEHSSFDFREIMDGKKIFLANLSKGRLGDRNTALLGLVLVSKFLQAAFSRVDARGVDLPVFYLYIDEFQNFATPSIGTILSEARKYKLSLIIAHQFIAQLDEKIRDSVIGNVGTKAAFRIGTTDAEFLAKQFEPVFTAPDLENLPNRNAVLSLLVNGVPARPFTLQTENLPQFDFSRLDALKELSYQTYGRDREEVEAEVRRKFAEADEPLALAAEGPAPLYR